jgi:glutamyl-Q tRNA(Asp) synthetase
VPVDPQPIYRGRFAPSPTGPLHLGSLIAALASYLDARHHKGIWLVRMEDLDPPREEPGAAQLILESLQFHGLHWDEDVLFQSQRQAAYAAALAKLAAQGLLFDCDCSRAQLAADGACRGSCRERQPSLSQPTATRVAIPPGCEIRFADAIQGRVHSALGIEAGDFVVKRKDGLDAYQLAVVVDDAWQGITHVVRGSDLLNSSARQIFLQQVLNYPTPAYSHIPVITDARGQKLSKQSHAPALANSAAAGNLRAALRFLCQPNPPGHLRETARILDFAISNWRAGRIPALLTRDASACALPSGSA